MRIYCLALGLLFTFISFTGFSQRVGVNTNNPHPSAALEVQSTSGGLLIPRMTNDQMKLISNPAAGLLIYNLDFDAYYLFEKGTWTSLESQARFVGRKSINNGVFADFTIDRRRYIWEINGSIAGGNSIPIPDSILIPLCGDEDGCRFQLQMANWTGANEPPVTKSGVFYFNPVTRAFRGTETNNPEAPLAGVDGNNVTNHAAIFFNQVYFTDAACVNGVFSDTAGSGMHLLKWTTYGNSTICRLILED